MWPMSNVREWRSITLGVGTFRKWEEQSGRWRVTWEEVLICIVDDEVTLRALTSSSLLESCWTQGCLLHWWGGGGMLEGMAVSWGSIEGGTEGRESWQRVVASWLSHKMTSQDQVTSMSGCSRCWVRYTWVGSSLMNMDIRWVVEVSDLRLLATEVSLSHHKLVVSGD